MNGDHALWLQATRRDSASAARLLAPEFRMQVGSVLAGPLLARTLRGGLFAVVDGDTSLPRVAVAVGAAPAEDQTDGVLVEAVRAAASHGLAMVHATGREAGVRWALVERVHGWPLRVLLGRRGLAFSGRRLAALGAELADVLATMGRAQQGVRLVHGRLSVGHVLIDVTGRARLGGSPVASDFPGLVPDAIGLGVTLACAALAVAPASATSTPASNRALAAALDRPEHSGRLSPSLRKLVQSLLVLDPRGFLPSMSVLRDEFARHMEGLPMGMPDPAWGRALSDAVQGLPPGHRPTAQDAQAVYDELLPHVEALRPPRPRVLALVPPPDLGAPIDGAELPDAG